MKNMRFAEFLDLMYRKQEIEFSYNGQVYWFELSNVKDIEGNPLMVNLFEISGNNGRCVAQFVFNEETYFDDINKLIEEPLFNGLSLLRIESNVEVISNS